MQTGSFAEHYTVTDVESDNVVVTEFVDDKQIRSFQATLGRQETIELFEKSLRYGGYVSTNLLARGVSEATSDHVQ